MFGMWVITLLIYRLKKIVKFMEQSNYYKNER